jgi:hypothetical protein
VFDAATGKEFVVRADGGISAFDGTRFTNIFSEAGLSVQALAATDGFLVAALKDSSIRLLTDQGIVLERISGLGADLNSLQVANVNGLVDVFLASQSQQVLAVLTFSTPSATRAVQGVAVLGIGPVVQAILGIPAQAPGGLNSVTAAPLALPTITVTAPVVVIFSGGGRVVVESSATMEGVLDLFPFALSAQMERLDLPTERDILSGMDIARSLFTGSRPQVNLVPQQQNTLVAVGALLPGDADDVATGKNQAGKPDGKDMLDVRTYLLSPVADTVLGPPFGLIIEIPGLSRGLEPSGPRGVPGPPPLAGPTGDGRKPVSTPSARWWEEALTLGLALTAGVAASAAAAESCRSLISRDARRSAGSPHSAARRG